VAPIVLRRHAVFAAPASASTCFHFQKQVPLGQRIPFRGALGWQLSAGGPHQRLFVFGPHPTGFAGGRPFSLALPAQDPTGVPRGAQIGDLGRARRILDARCRLLVSIITAKDGLHSPAPQAFVLCLLERSIYSTNFPRLRKPGSAAQQWDFCGFLPETRVHKASARNTELYPGYAVIPL